MADIDHLIYAAPDLDEGMDAIEAILGVRPARGGHHPHFGTHNALLSLGPSTYLEVIARDPGLPRPERGVLFGLDSIRAPGLVTWVLRREDLDEAVVAAAAADVELGAVSAGSRKTPDGGVVAWRVTVPYAMPLGGAVPFLIAWGDTPHPAVSAPAAGTLVGLSIEHPEPTRLRPTLAALGADVDVSRGPRVRLAARVATHRGEVELD
jgi:hypothetical protein